jgi:hypothetical protein
MRTPTSLALLALLTLPGPTAAAQARPAQLEVDHLMIHVAAGAPERAALERAGFIVAPTVNRHDGQGSAAVMVELRNGFIELAWRDDAVPVAPGLEAVANRFRRQSEWKTSGWSPLGIGLRRASGAPDSLPFPTRVVRSEWMRPGAAIEIVSAATDSLGPRLWVVPAMMAANGIADSDSERDRLSKPEDFRHPNGAQRITAVKVIAPESALTTATRLIGATGVVTFERGPEWILDVTLDGGARRQTRDLRPALPMVVHY